MFTVVLTKKAEKEFQRLPEKDRVRVEEAIDTLHENPFEGKKLQGQHEGLWSVRVWPYRIVYAISKKTVTVTVVAIGDRKDVYR